MTAVILEFPREEKYPESSGDSVYVLRETPAWKVRDRWQVIKRLRDELILHHSLNSCDEIVPLTPPVEQKGIARVFENFGIWFCRNFHRVEDYEIGETFSECRCGRKYALPWAFPTHPTILSLFPIPHDPHVYVNTEPFPWPSEKTRQAPARHGTQGVI